MRRIMLAAAIAAAFAAAAAAQRQQEREKPRGWQAYCFWGDTDWFGPCRNESHHARKNRERHNEQVHAGENRADYDIGECEPPTGR